MATGILFPSAETFSLPCEARDPSVWVPAATIPASQHPATRAARRQLVLSVVVSLALHGLALAGLALTGQGRTLMCVTLAGGGGGGSPGGGGGPGGGDGQLEGTIGLFSVLDDPGSAAEPGAGASLPVADVPTGPIERQPVEEPASSPLPPTVPMPTPATLPETAAADLVISVPAEHAIPRAAAIQRAEKTVATAAFPSHGTVTNLPRADLRGAKVRGLVFGGTNDGAGSGQARDNRDGVGGRGARGAGRGAGGPGGAGNGSGWGGGGSGTGRGGSGHGTGRGTGDGSGDGLPGLLYGPSPQYPADALAARQTGRVLLRIQVAADGLVLGAAVERSCGVPSLDAAAIEAVRQWRFAAADSPTAPVRELAAPIRFLIESQ